MIDLRLLRYFVAVADAGSFNRASERLNIAQPPLSRAIQQLEALVGAGLLDRSIRPLRLTSVGSLLYAQARQMLARMEDMEGMLKAAAASERRRFVIGFVASTIYARLPELIRVRTHKRDSLGGWDVIHALRQQERGFERVLVE